LTPKPINHETTDTKQVTQKNILLIDDDVNILDSMSLLLESWGYIVATCQSQNEVWEKLEIFTPHLIISDYRFHGTEQNGLALIHDIRQKTRLSLPALLITADTHSDVGDYLEHNLNEEAKAITCVTIKPVLPAKLKLIIQHYMADV
jgi:CheY-like chemotaxis protein